MIDDLDIQLSHDHFPNEQLINQEQYAPDMMLQPITTQQKFNKMQNKLSKSIKSDQSQNNINFQQAFAQQNAKQQIQNQNKSYQTSQSRKFRQYLSDKVIELKKSQQIKNKLIPANQQAKLESKANVLRKIIDKQQDKQKQINKKSQHQNKQINTSKSINQNKKTIQPAITSNSLYTDNKNMKNIKNQKRFSNSHSNLAKNNSRQENQTKKSIQLPSNSKTPKLPNITSQSANPPFPSKKQLKNFHQIKPLAKNLNTRQKQTINNSITPQTKNSFRIKRTSNVNITDNSSNKNIPPSNKNIPQKNQKMIKKASTQNVQKQVIKSNKSISKESPVISSNNKKIRQQFMRLNQQQKVLQQQIFRHHNQTKKILQTKLKKFNLSSEAYQKYGIKRNSELFTRIQNLHQQNLSLSKATHHGQRQLSKSQQKKQQQNKINQSPIKKQRKFNSFLDQQLQKINNLLKLKDKEINKASSKVQKNPFIVFLRQTPEDQMALIQQNQEQQNQQVNQLPKFSNIDESKLASTYGQVMGQMKNKKWGLKQRITFQTHRDQGSISKITKVRQNKQIIKSPKQAQMQGQMQENGDNRIEVNSRLKNLLLD